ncbi:hypothetical protein BDW71DRAFT_209313 [Aspergillus fruticulosus]
MLNVHNRSQFNCTDLDLLAFKRDLQLHVLTGPVGHLESFQSQCPLPITDNPTPPEGHLFSQFDLLFTLGSVHRMQTIAGDLVISSTHGKGLDCAGVRITPDIGATASAIFTYIPAVILLLVGIASWHRHFNKRGTGATFEHITAGGVWRSIWKIVLDLADYLRYLQFVFLAGALTIDYPGFYQPVVGQLSWSSLLYWPGPIDHGFTYPGVEDGMYVSNASYGLDYMARMVAHPRVPDIMINAHINLLILVCGVIAILVALCLVTGASDQLPLSTMVRNTGCLVLGAALLLFSFPLMALMSNELRLIGYLPNYRVILIALVTTVFFFLNFMAQYHFESEQAPTGALLVGDSREARQQTSPMDWSRRFLHYLPHAVVLLQGLVIGWLQDWGFIQLVMLIVCELVLLVYLIMRRRWNFFMSRSVWCALIRLLTLTLSISFAFPMHEVTQQWIGYFILCLHAAVVVFGYLLLSGWELYCAGRLSCGSIHAPSECDPPLSLHVLSSAARDELHGESPHSGPASATTSYRGYNKSRPNTASSSTAPIDMKHYITDFSAFYRPPRSRNQPPIISTQVSPLASDSGTSDASSRSAGPALLGSEDTLNELLELPSRPGVDYSVRESDSFYGRPRAVCSPESPPTSVLGSFENPTPRHSFLERTRRYLRDSRTKEKGFQVMRPPRPT